MSSTILWVESPSSFCLNQNYSHLCQYFLAGSILYLNTFTIVKFLNHQPNFHLMFHITDILEQNSYTQRNNATTLDLQANHTLCNKNIINSIPNNINKINMFIATISRAQGLVLMLLQLLVSMANYKKQSVTATNPKLNISRQCKVAKRCGCRTCINCIKKSSK